MKALIKIAGLGRSLKWLAEDAVKSPYDIAMTVASKKAPHLQRLHDRLEVNEEDAWRTNHLNHTVPMAATGALLGTLAAGPAGTVVGGLGGGMISHGLSKMVDNKQYKKNMKKYLKDNDYGRKR